MLFIAWPDASSAEPFPSLPVDSEHPLFIAYTSGTTGSPRARSTCTAASSAKIAEEVAFQFDVATPDDRLFWFADMGWIMGPWAVVGTLAAGRHARACTKAFPIIPRPIASGPILERHRVTMLGISPTLDPLADAHGEEPVARARTVGAAHSRLHRRAVERGSVALVLRGRRRRRCPIINISGGTEVGACFLSPHPVEPIKPMSLGGPALGMAVDVFDDDGQAGARRGRRAGVHEALARDDARPLQGRPSATSRRTGRAGPTCGSTAIGRRSTRTAIGFCTAAATTP